MHVSQSSIDFTASGQTASVTASEANFGGAFGALSANGAIATVNPASGATFTITAGTSAGTTTIAVTDGHGQTVNVTVNVTLTTGTIQ
jgi:hypothetical protein